VNLAASSVLASKRAAVDRLDGWGYLVARGRVNLAAPTYLPDRVDGWGLVVTRYGRP
jgi:hypothetical protein